MIKKLLKKRWGYISIEVVILASIMLVSGFSFLGGFVQKGQTASNDAASKIDDVLNLVGGGEGAGPGGSGGGAGGSGEEGATAIAGLYPTGSIALYRENGADAITGTEIYTWEYLLENGIIYVEDGVVYTEVDWTNYVNASSDVLSGDLILPSDGSVKHIGNMDPRTNSGHAGFFMCMNLTGVYIPGSIESLNTAFTYCTALKTVIFEENSKINKIGGLSFLGCISMDLITLENLNNLTIIEESAFNHCSSLRNIIIPASVEVLQKSAFVNCDQLESVTFEDNSNLKNINESTFEMCVSLKNIILPASLHTIEEYAFSGCESLEFVYFENGSQLSLIKDSAFASNNSLKKLYFDMSMDEMYNLYGSMTVESSNDIFLNNTEWYFKDSNGNWATDIPK